MKFKERVAMIQSELKAPKNQRNNFGNYNYRSAEDILEAVKPINKKYECILTIRDDVVAVGDRIYIKATANLQDVHSDESIEVSAFARESETKKGMDDSQITGTASSYARKYALNGLYCIDDTKDADTDQFTQRTKVEYPKKAQKDILINEINKKGLDMQEVLESVGVAPGTKMTMEQYGKALRLVNES